MQDRPKSLKDSVVCLRRVLCQESSHLPHEAYGDFDTVVSGLSEHEHKHLEGHDFVGDGLIDQMSDEGSGRLTNNLQSQQVKI
jgi:hypothetical protein